MQSGVATITRWWLLAACGRNPLVRAVDRLQLLVIALAILAGLFAAAAAGALGTAVHEARTSTYAAQSQMRQSATATAATATAAGASTETRMSVWQLRIGAPQGHPASQRVDPQMVSDIRSACRVDAAHSTRQATVDAIAIACVAWQAVAIAVAGLVCWTRSRLDRSRDAAWENDIRELLNDGGRTRD